MLMNGSSHAGYDVQANLRGIGKAMAMNLLRKRALTGSVLLVALSVMGAVLPASAQSDSLEMLSKLAKGEWTIKYRNGSTDRKICVRSGLELIQLQHADRGCNRFVVEDDTARVTVQYTCPGNGYGRTSIRRETGSLVQIESQGIESGLPFQFAGEARHTGSC